MVLADELVAVERLPHGTFVARRAEVNVENLGACSTLFRWADAGKIVRHKINAHLPLSDEAAIVSLAQGVRV
ncbi:hypothetical protein K0B96_13780 [Horticoccus luteus]|uniref:Uncharacterized protein n=1 Tax=Horticoccus luteus TaxID=2862869 RepID=A0A8F9TU67_9BACT|nr:hypothetical protein [Horticoccus luteus]QYM78358.1 hypothetical protein K0B96_13780 [Horticoccus luteus]